MIVKKKKLLYPESRNSDDMDNPFSLSFGKEPLKYISREPEREQIISDFSSEYPTSNIYMLTGVRGSGKTVLLSSVANELRKTATGS